MVANKDMEMPSGCLSVTTRPFYSDELVYNYCPFCNTCEHRHFSEVNVRPDDCPLVEIVTCKDCKYCVITELGCYCDRHIHRLDTCLDKYCADAERRE